MGVYSRQRRTAWLSSAITGLTQRRMGGSPGNTIRMILRLLHPHLRMWGPRCTNLQGTLEVGREDVWLFPSVEILHLHINSVLHCTVSYFGVAKDASPRYRTLEVDTTESEAIHFRNGRRPSRSAGPRIASPCSALGRTKKGADRKT